MHAYTHILSETAALAAERSEIAQAIVIAVWVHKIVIFHIIYNPKNECRIVFRNKK